MASTRFRSLKEAREVAFEQPSIGRRSSSGRSLRRPDVQGRSDAVPGNSVSRLRRGPRSAHQKAAGAPCVPELRGPSGGRDSDRRLDAGPGAAVATATADRAAAPAEDRGRYGLERCGRLSGGRPDPCSFLPCCRRAGSSGTTIGTCRPRTCARRWPKVNGSGAWVATRLAMRFLALTAGGQLRSAKWHEVDLKSATWVVCLFHSWECPA